MSRRKNVATLDADIIMDDDIPEIPKTRGKPVGKKTAKSAAKPAAKPAATKTRGGAAAKKPLADEIMSDDEPDNDAVTDDESINEKAKEDEEESEGIVASTVTSDEDDVDDEIYDDFVPTGDDLTSGITECDHIYVPADQRRTVGVMGSHAAAAIIAIRTQQIAKTGLTTVSKNGCDTNEDIARRELLEGKIPIMIRRVAGTRHIDGKKVIEYELWRANELALPIGL
jgi:DNA-directed RNA polymerase subunit K/omega